MAPHMVFGFGHCQLGHKTAFRRLILLTVALAAIGLIGTGCTPPIAPATHPTTGPAEDAPRGVIVGFEGLQPWSGFSAYQLVKDVGESCQLTYAAGSGGYSTFMPLIREAHKQSRPVYLVGYSLGGDQARRLAVSCQKENIPVRILFLLDPHYMTAAKPEKVPSNVQRVVFYMSSAYRQFGHAVPTPGDLEDATQTTLIAEDARAVWHTGLPSYVTPRVRIEVAADVDVPTARASMPLPPDLDTPETRPGDEPASTQPAEPAEPAPANPSEATGQSESRPATQPATEPN